jgi:S-adenosylmethionine:tRNA ribosyltransferase-isomerase
MGSSSRSIPADDSVTGRGRDFSTLSGRGIWWWPTTTAVTIDRARRSGSRIVAVGTTVVRALEHAAAATGDMRAGAAVATQTIEGASRLRVVDAILTGVHEPGTSHYRLLRAFVDDATLRRAHEELRAHDYRTHEFGDSVLIERSVTEH